MPSARVRPSAALLLLLAAALATPAQERRERIATHAGEPLGHDTLFFEPAQEGVDIAVDKAMTGFVVTEFGFGGEAVKGAPYSAEAVSETTQTLGDGNRIVRSTRSTLYRDSLGRTRREERFTGPGPFASGRQPELRIFVNDPTAGVNYTLDPATRTARRFAHAGDGPWSSPFGGLKEGRVIEKETRVVGDADKAKERGAMIAIGPSDRAVIEHKIRTATGGGFVAAYSTESRLGSNSKTESLGKRLIEGVEADGTRTTVTIPAGEIGNERPIDIVSERWYSPELQVVLSLRHSDPRFGENHYYLTNIRRSDPSSSLFEIPSDYKVEEGLLKFERRIERKPE
jgi:hypothetical protein